MAHSLILGMTESGKTTLATRLAHFYQDEADTAVMVLDPLCDPRWMSEARRKKRENAVAARVDGIEIGGTTALQKFEEESPFFQTADPDTFLKVFWNSLSCMVFIDESGDTVGRYDLAMQQTATKGRHWGHSVHFLSQRGAQISRTVRDQCSHLFLFTTAKKDAQLHADEWNQPELITASLLQQGEYFHVTRFGKLERGKLF